MVRRGTTKGFTIIELTVVVVVVGLLAAVAIPRLSGARTPATRAAGVADLRNLAAAQERFYGEFGRYATLGEMTAARYATSQGNTLVAIETQGRSWNALVRIPNGQTCAIRFGDGAPAPAAWAGPALADGVATCER